MTPEEYSHGAPQRRLADREDLYHPSFSWRQMDDHFDKKLQPIREDMKELSDKMDAMLEMMKGTVPDGDLVGHRKAHEEWISERAEKRKIMGAVKTRIIESAIWTVLAALLAASWYWIKGNVK